MSSPKPTNAKPVIARASANAYSPNTDGPRCRGRTSRTSSATLHVPMSDIPTTNALRNARALS